MSKLTTILDEYGYDIIGIAVDEDLTSAQKLEENTQATQEAQQQIKTLAYDLAADCFPDDENFKKFVQKLDSL